MDRSNDVDDEARDARSLDGSRFLRERGCLRGGGTRCPRGSKPLPDERKDGDANDEKDRSVPPRKPLEDHVANSDNEDVAVVRLLCAGCVSKLPVSNRSGRAGRSREERCTASP